MECLQRDPHGRKANEKEYLPLPTPTAPSHELTTTTVEDYRPGYPRFTALLSAYEPYFFCRRFSRLRARLLLLKQDKVTLLEQKLDEIDDQEGYPLFLGMSRSDKNTSRASVLSEIESCLADYGTCKHHPTVSMLTHGR